MKKYVLIVVSLLTMPFSVSAHEYPTIDTVRFVINCMAEQGAQTEENLYVCTCRHDVFTELMSFAEYDDATFFEHNKKMPGKRGAMVRDNEKAIKDSGKLEQVQQEANARCPAVKHIESTVKRKDAN